MRKIILNYSSSLYILYFYLIRSYPLAILRGFRGFHCLANLGASVLGADNLRERSIDETSLVSFS